MKKGMSVWKGMSRKKKTAVAIVSLAGICILGTGVFWARNKMSKGSLWGMLRCRRRRQLPVI